LTILLRTKFERLRRSFSKFDEIQRAERVKIVEAKQTTNVAAMCQRERERERESERARERERERRERREREWIIDLVA
jgi:Zn-finger nucleic acid-binding protein